VLSNNDDCASARSNEAKDLEMVMIPPWFQIRHLEEQVGLVALSANFESRVRRATAS
jgi:DNA polymerase V